MKLNKKQTEKVKDAMRRSMAIFMAFLTIFQTLVPYQAYALTGGPSQPEVQSFEPVGTSNMVSLFSGDFNYNIPLLSVDGYPINISYHSGNGMDAEASWVGLGWNVNAGVVNRQMRGIPDDFDGDTIHKDITMKPNRTFGVKGGAGLEIFGYDKKGVPTGGPTGSIGVSAGISYNNYSGIGMEQGLSFSMLSGDKVKDAGGCIGLGLNMNSSNTSGFSVSPSLSYSTNMKMNEAKDKGSSFGLKIGSSFNSRAGLSQLTITASRTTKRIKEITSGKNKGGTATFKSSTNRTAKFDFGTPTFIPSVSTSMKNFAASARFTAGSEIIGFNGNLWIEGYLSSQTIRDKSLDNPAYGYMNTEKGQNNLNAMLDFNREKDGPFMPTTPALSLINYTFDTYSLSAQGTGGSFRTMRNDVGYVFDVRNGTTSGDFSLGVELGGGNTIHGGVDISVHDITTNTKRWTQDNNALSKLKSQSAGDDISYENFYFKEAGERSVSTNPGWIESMGGYEAVKISLQDCGNFCARATGQWEKANGQKINITKNYKKNRDARNQAIGYLTNNELVEFGISGNGNNYPGHHIGEISSIQPGGSRFVYGSPAYNTLQEEVTFSIDDGNGDCQTGLVASFSNEQNSLENKSGIDHYYSAVTTPPFAHSYLLTSVISNDYVDLDDILGPSDNDLGSYTRFSYKTITDYKWRTPFDGANFNEGLKSDSEDDKASYIYGTKDLNYLDTIITKNQIAIFHTSDRFDGYGVSGRNGGIDTNLAQQKLDSISLYSKPQYNAELAAGLTPTPLKRTHFEYNYSLCKGIPNHDPGSPDADKGKLTLKKIYFTYQGSNKARFSPYIFDYANNDPNLNPNYDSKGYDRWGCYKPNDSNGCGVTASLTNGDYPYVDQDKTLADQYTQVWNLTSVILPSGGKINVEYEANDYAYVQHKRAQQMFKIVGFGPSDVNTTPTSSNCTITTTPTREDLNSNNKRRFLLFALHNGVTDINEYFNGIDFLYFRFLAGLKTSENDKFDFVQGYAEIDPSSNSKGIVNVGGTDYGYVMMKGVELDGNSGGNYSPVTKATIYYGIRHLSRIMNSQPGVDSDGGLGADILNALIGSNFASTIAEAVNGIIEHKYDLLGTGKKFVTHKSYIRLNNPDKRKYGGGCRVSKITSSDEWAAMTPAGAGHQTMVYGQEYSYNLTDGTSSGVASYEPQIGGDENPWRKPDFFEKENLLIPDEAFYIEEPYGESFFPGPSIGYSKVTVQNLKRANVNRHATGKVVHEFFTAKDFPTITQRTSPDKVMHKTNPFSITSLLGLKAKDYMTVSQGFYIELNDMHGKQRSQKVYQEDKTTPISSVTYKYQSEPYLNGQQRLSSDVKVIHSDGTTSIEEVGVFHDMAVDFRHSQTNSGSFSSAINLDMFFIGPFPILIPMLWPKTVKEETRFRSSSTTKVVQRMGILEEVIAEDLGSVVSTKNLAYDSKTGDVLLTETVTDFNDEVYSLKFPASWYYKQLGSSYENLNIKVEDVNFNVNGELNMANADKFFRKGDELALSTGEKAWVLDVDHNSIRAVHKNNSPASATSFKVTRSGNRNAISTPMANITTRSNPIDKIQSNTYDKVLSASASEFTDKWRTYCDCISDQFIEGNNPYAVGRKGNWRLKRSQLYLTDRARSDYNGNTNIREDGVFSSFKPFYRVQSDGTWVKDVKNWTFTSEVSEFSPLGQELENRDALGRYSASTFGFNGTLPTIVAANTRHRELGFDSFEDYDFNQCIDGHFKFEATNVSDEQAHTGWHSLKVAAGSSVIMNKDLISCELEECLLTVEFDKTGLNTPDIFIEGKKGTPPYEYNWNAVSGFPVVTPWATTGGIRISGSSWVLDVIITDAEGCTAVKQFSTKKPYAVELQNSNYSE